MEDEQLTEEDRHGLRSRAGMDGRTAPPTLRRNYAKAAGLDVVSVACGRVGLENKIRHLVHFDALPDQVG